MKMETKAVVASLVVIALALTAVSGVTYSWFSDEETAKIDVTTGVVDIQSTNGQISVDDGESTPFNFDTESTSVILNTPIVSGNVIKISYTLTNNSTVDTSLAISCGFKEIPANLYDVSIEVSKSGSKISPDATGYYSIGAKDENSSQYNVFIIISDINIGNEYMGKSDSITITNNAVQTKSLDDIIASNKVIDALKKNDSTNVVLDGSGKDINVILNEDITSSSCIVTNGNVKLTVNGSITCGGVVVSSGKLTLGGNGVIKANGDAVTVSPGANFKMTGSTVNAKWGVIIGDHSKNFDATSATAEITGGKVIATESALIIGNNSSLTISGGEFTANDNAVLQAQGADVKSVTVNITGGKFIGNISTAGYAAIGIMVSSNGTWNISGAEFDITNGAAICVRSGIVNVGADNTYNVSWSDSNRIKFCDSTFISMKEGAVIVGYYNTMSNGSYFHQDTDSLTVGSNTVSLEVTDDISSTSPKNSNCWFDKDGNSVN